MCASRGSRSGGSASARIPRLNVDALIETASEQAGSNDFGGTAIRDGLDRLVDALDTEAELSDLGVVAIEAQITGALANRLRVTRWITEHPEVLDEPVARPLVVVGLPRTGTTLLSYLLGCDPARRSLMRWEATNSVPPPETATFTSDPRIAEAREGAAMMDVINPGFKAIHYEAPDGPTECVTILAQDFRSMLWSSVAVIPTYDEWMLACDQSSAYAYHRRELQLLQSCAPGRWSLKTPHHSIALDALFAQYPDAQVVVLHRDPVRVVGSVCSLVRSLAGTFSDADHGATIASHWPDMAAAIIEGVCSYRDEHGDDAFLDVAYADLVVDPMATMSRIYDWTGDELTAAAEAAMRGYVAANPQDRHGRHTYTLPDGLDRGALEERFGWYRERFAIPREDVA